MRRVPQRVRLDAAGWMMPPDNWICPAATLWQLPPPPPPPTQGSGRTYIPRGTAKGSLNTAPSSIAHRRMYPARPRIPPAPMPPSPSPALAAALLLLLPLLLGPGSASAFTPNPPAAHPPGRSGRGTGDHHPAFAFASASAKPLRAAEAGGGTTAGGGGGGGASSSPSDPPTYWHTLAILTLPSTSADRIANDAVLEAAMARTTGRLSVVLRGTDLVPRPALHQLRGYVGEIYSAAWDATLGFDRKEGTGDDGMLLPAGSGGGRGEGPAGTAPVSSSSSATSAAAQWSAGLLDVIVYPQNLPNAAPEGWIALRPELSCVCSHDTLTGWAAAGGGGTGAARMGAGGDGSGGLDAHVDAVNADRTHRGLNPVAALHVDPWPVGAGVTDDESVVFLEDSDGENDRRWERARQEAGVAEAEEAAPPPPPPPLSPAPSSDTGAGGLLGGARVPDRSLYRSVAVGGTFDGMHYGHRKLLSLAVSSVRPGTGKLLIGVTADSMLGSKSFRDLIPPLDERVRGVRDFVESLAPGLKNRMRVIPIDDAYGPPGSPDPALNDFDALVLSHETLPTGKKLNEHRAKNLGMEPLALLCTRRTEPHGMSSTALRRMRKNVRTEANMI